MAENLSERQSQSTRILYFDYLEAVSIFLVVSVHDVFLKGTILSSVAMSIPPAAVPVFFMVHGALLLSRNASPEKQFRRFLRVLFQLLAWKTIYLLLSLAVGMVAPSDLTPGFFYRYYLENADLGGFTQGHLWFIYALLSVYLAYPVLCALRDTGERALCYLCAVTFCLSFLNQEISVYGTFLGERLFGKAITCDTLLELLNPFGYYTNCIFYFTLGYLIFLWVGRAPKGQRSVLACAAILSLGGISFLLLERWIAFGQLAYNWKPLSWQYERLGTAMLACGIFLLFAVLPLKEGRLTNIVTSVSTHTLDIYYIHKVLSELFYDNFYASERRGILLNALRALILLTLSYGIGQLIRRIPVLKKLLT